MKAFSLVAFLLFISSLNAFSQILVGPVTGANYSWTSLKDSDIKDAYQMSPVVGFHVGDFRYTYFQDPLQLRNQDFVFPLPSLLT